MNPLVLIPLSRRLEKEGYLVDTFKYPLFPNNKQLTEKFIDDVYLWEPEIIIGHSLGGNIAVKQITKLDKSVKCIICLGSPLKGSAIARFFRNKPYLPVFSKAALSMLSDEISLKKTSIYTGVIAGDNNKIGFRYIFPVVSGQNDGTVMVNETHVEGLADHVVMPVGHTALIFSKSVVTQILYFIEKGIFMKVST
jgi:hypothetical protein